VAGRGYCRRLRRGRLPGAIYARRPLRDAGDPLALLGRGLGNPRATLDLAGQVLTVQSVHANPPMPLGIEPWQHMNRSSLDAPLRSKGS
jgi:hypothetical protein